MRVGYGGGSGMQIVFCSMECDAHLRRGREVTMKIDVL